jgi:hypothetical protein
VCRAANAEIIASRSNSLPVSAEVMAPLVARLANSSFSSGDFKSSLKQGRVTLLLKKLGLEKSKMASYRSINNINSL